MSAVRLSFHDGVFWLHDDGDYIALPLAEHDELVGLLGEARDLMSYVGCQDCLSDDPLLTGSWDRTKARLDRALARLGRGGGA